MSADTTQVEVPDIGDFDDVPVIEILVVRRRRRSRSRTRWSRSSPTRRRWTCPAPFAGVVQEINVSVGDRVAQGSC